VWSAQEIEEGRARCAVLLKGLDLVAVPADPIREGAACGAPAPMRLVSIGSSPPLAFSPPPTLTCDMIAALHKWLQQDVQPLARKHLGSPVVVVQTMSSFSCRNAYGRAQARLSEHGRVNALDLGAFLSAQGETTLVVADWGPTARESAPTAVAVQAEAVKRQAEAAAAARKAKAPEGPRLATPETVKSLQAGVTIGIPGITLSPRPSSTSNGLSTGFGWAPPSKLGGPKAQDTGTPAPPGATAEPQSDKVEPADKARFLHAVHKAACTIFTTVLGPEANSAHKNHFHLDMAPRSSASICE
jgi:hypothetical protein